MVDRYDVSGSPEGQYQPGSENRVLLNKLAITNSEDMDDVELIRLNDFQDQLIDQVREDQKITANDLRNWHRTWLNEVYEWAGDYRSVNMEKDGFPFAASYLIPKLMEKYESECLDVYTPCNNFDSERLVKALAICHIEFIIIHPFREGNGRLARTLAVIMALQAGKPLLNFTFISRNQKQYISAIHSGHRGDYTAMMRVFSEVLQNSTS